jgi:hypothetical protein
MRSTGWVWALAMAAMLPGAAGPALAVPVETEAVRGSLAGQVVVRSLENGMVVALDEQGDGIADRLYRVETYGPPAPLALRVRSAQVLFWKGHLVVIAPEKEQAIHFSLPAFEGKSYLPASVPGPRGQRAADLDTLLGALYDLTRIDTATAILSRAGQLGLSLAEVETGQDLEPGLISLGMGLIAQNPDPLPPGDGGCGGSCQISCRDGSSCSASCGPNRCASCSCPASCTCT